MPILPEIDEEVQIFVMVVFDILYCGSCVSESLLTKMFNKSVQFVLKKNVIFSNQYRACSDDITLILQWLA